MLLLIKSYFRKMIEPRENTLLIADPFLSDENFLRTVVYLCRHAESEGSFGFIINKPFDFTLDQLMEGIEGSDIPVYVGGPVEKDSIHFLHQLPELIPNSFQLSEDVYWGGDFETVKSLINAGKLDTKKIKFFIGYSGWGEHQLSKEIEEKSWITAKNNRKILFEIPPEQIWKESLKHLGGEYEGLINYPIDPRLN